MPGRVRHIIRKISQDKSERAELEDSDDETDGPEGAGSYDEHGNPREGIYAVAWRLGYVLRKWWVVVSLTAVVAISVYYYNNFWFLRSYAQRDAASVNVYMQMRRDLSANLEKSVIAYAQHERDIFKNVMEFRTMMVGMTPDMKKALVEKSDKKSSELMGKFFGIAEQYPDLKLSAEFHFLVATIESAEKELAAARVRYNVSVDNYTTALATIPGNFFAVAFRFKPLPYFEPEKSATEFAPLDFNPK
ncbi:LemA family protein [Bdellovibrionota bacterium FG-2]